MDKTRWIMRVLGMLLLTVGVQTVVLAQEVTPEVTPEATAEPLPAGAILDFPGAGAYSVQVVQGSADRAYGVYIPESYVARDTPAPLVIVLHGASGNGLLMETQTGFDALADEHGFIVSYPDGIEGFWADGRPGDPRVSAQVSDIAYVRGIILFLGTKLSIDPARVYLVGYSMGGMLALRAGCELADRVTAVASVASTMPEYVVPYCQNSAPIGVAFVIGTDDTSIPWVGQPRQGTGYMSANNSLAYWAAHNGCTDAETMTVLDDTDPADGTRVILSTYSACEGGSAVNLYGVYRGGHTWPSRPSPIGFDAGAVSNDIDATQVIWDFFSGQVR